MKILKLAPVIFAALFAMCSGETPPLLEPEQLPEGKSIMLTSPENVDVVYVGDTLEINWIADSSVLCVCIEFSNDGGIIFENIDDMGCVNYGDSDWGSYKWIVPDSSGRVPFRVSTISDNCMLRILSFPDNNINDYTNSFAIQRRN